MTPSAIIAAIEARGAHVVLVDDAVKLRSPNVVPDDLRAEARNRRPEIAALLKAAAGEPPLREFAFWKAVYEDVEFWPPGMQTVFVERSDALETEGLARDAAEAKAYLELRQAAVAPSPACWLRERRGLDDRAFEALCRRTIRRPAPSTAKEDARVAAAVLALPGRREP